MAESVTRFGAVDESFSSTIQKMEGRLEGFSGEVNELGENTSNLPAKFAQAALAVAGFIGALAAGFASVKTFMDAIEMAGALDDLSIKTGESAGNLAILQRAFERAGLSASNVGPAIANFQKFLFDAGQEGTKQAEVLNHLGLAFDDLINLPLIDQLRLVAERIAAIENPALKSAAAQLAFKKMGADLIPLLQAFGVELEVSRAELGSYPEALNRAAAAMADIGDHFNAIKNKGIEFATGLLVNVAPGLAEVTKKIAEIDAARLGMILSEHLANFLKAADGALGFSRNLDAVKIAIQGMADGQISEGLSLMFVTAKIQAMSLVNEFVMSFTAGLQTIGGFFSDMFASDGALIHLLSTTFGMIGDKFVAVFSNALADVFANIPFIGEDTAEALRYSAETAERSFNAALFGIGAQVDLVGEQFFEAGAAMPKAFSENRSKLDPLFDLTDELAEQKRLQENIKANLEASAQEAGKTADNIGRANENATGFQEKVDTATDDLNFSADLYTGPDGVAAATKEAASKTSSASKDTVAAFNTAKGAGEKLETNLKNAAINFGREVLESGRLFKQDVTAAMGQITSFTKGLATEATLQRAANALERLERKLPQPALVP